MLHQRVNGALACCIGRDRPDHAARPQRRKENDAATLRQDRKQLLDQKEGSANVDGEQLIEILNGRLFDRRGLSRPPH